MIRSTQVMAMTQLLVARAMTELQAIKAMTQSGAILRMAQKAILQIAVSALMPIQSKAEKVLILFTVAAETILFMPTLKMKMKMATRLPQKILMDHLFMAAIMLMRFTVQQALTILKAALKVTISTLVMAMMLLSAVLVQMH